MVCLHGQLVTAIVFRMAAVSGYASVFDAMASNLLVESLPKIVILERFELSSFPPLPIILFPLGHPVTNAFADVNAIRKEFDAAWPLELAQAFHDGRQFHAIVRRHFFAAGHFQFFAAGQVSEDKSPAAWARVSTAGPVGVKVYVDIVRHISFAGPEKT